MAIGNHDFLNAWKFHCEACDLARQLGYDQLDNPAVPRVEENDTHLESKRKGFWQLVHTDYVFRMYFGKPAVITSTKFHVNLPALQLGTSASFEAMSDEIGDTTFIVTSRIAFILGEFFQILESNPPPNVRSKEEDARIDSLCDEIEILLVDWKIVRIHIWQPPFY